MASLRFCCWFSSSSWVIFCGVVAVGMFNAASGDDCLNLSRLDQTRCLDIDSHPMEDRQIPQEVWNKHPQLVHLSYTRHNGIPPPGMYVAPGFLQAMDMLLIAWISTTLTLALMFLGWISIRCLRSRPDAMEFDTETYSTPREEEDLKSACDSPV